MTDTSPEGNARRLAAESLAVDDVTGWFDRLYSAADRGGAVVPWDRHGPHPLLVQWAAETDPTALGRALVVGAGLGEDAEFVAGLGYATAAFDVSATALRAARRRFPQSAVQFTVADLLVPPDAWRAGFDLVVESLTVQSLPPTVHRVAIENVARFVAPGGTLLVIASALAAGDPGEVPPWPLSRVEIDAFTGHGLQAVRLDLIPVPQDPTAHRWLAEFHRPSS